MENLIREKIKKLGILKNELPIISLIKELRSKLNLKCDYYYIDEVKNDSIYVLVYCHEDEVNLIKFTIDNTLKIMESGG